VENGLDNLAEKSGLNIGCGSDVRPDFVNLDVVQLPGVDVVWDVAQFPYPFVDDRFSSVLMINVLEHLPNTIQVLEEVWRISEAGAAVTVRVPYWNSLEQSTDPTHVRSFNERSFDYFDPSKALCRRRPYYSTARFTVRSVMAWIFIVKRYFILRNPFVSRAVFGLSHYLSNITRLIEFELEVLK
jgi:SAM-dependent methyltransferase